MNGGGANLPDFHETATLPKRPEARLTSVALLTGRDHKDGLGGLRAVLFILAWILFGAFLHGLGGTPSPCARSNGISILPRFSRQSIELKCLYRQSIENGGVKGGFQVFSLWNPRKVFNS